MGIFYNMSKDTDVVVIMVQEEKIPELQYYANKESLTQDLWPHGVTDGKNYGWFEEGRIIHFWGRNNPTKILDALRRAGIRCTFGG